MHIYGLYSIVLNLTIKSNNNKLDFVKYRYLQIFKSFKLIYLSILILKERYSYIGSSQEETRFQSFQNPLKFWAYFYLFFLLLQLNK